MPEPPRRRVMVDHRVHRSGRDAEEEARPTEFLEIKKVNAAMLEAAKNNDFLEAARLRDEMIQLQNKLDALLKQNA